LTLVPVLTEVVRLVVELWVTSLPEKSRLVVTVTTKMMTTIIEIVICCVVSEQVVPPEVLSGIGSPGVEVLVGGTKNFPMQQLPLGRAGDRQNCELGIRSITF
jgi:hypothetical protein